MFLGGGFVIIGVLLFGVLLWGIVFWIGIVLVLKLGKVWFLLFDLVVDIFGVIDLEVLFVVVGVVVLNLKLWKF